jgi:hypothetical protein
MPTLTQSIALWRAYEGVCVYCNKPIESLASLEIDHIIPEKLAKSPGALQNLLDRLGVPGLKINSYLNWLPVHGRPCNRQKGDQLLPDATLQNYLSIARQRADRVRDEEEKIRRQALNRNVLAPLVSRIEAGYLSKQEVISIIEAAVSDSAQSSKSEPLVLSFSVNVIDAMNSSAFPKDAPVPPALYDWLEAELERVLGSTRALFAKMEDDRNGETVSARYAFWLVDLDTLPNPLPYCWKLLQVAPFSNTYPTHDADNLFARSIHTKHDELVFDQASSDPLPYQRCPNCMSPDLRRVSSMRDGEEILTIWCECGWADRF